ncbi:MAG: ATP synthase F0 subunit B [Desulfobacterales bacterium]|jgi:F-type H+-transporting ATPase subunit b
MRIFGLYRKCFTAGFLTLVFVLRTTSLALAASEESGGGGITVLPDGSLIIQIANFLLIIWILNLILYRPIRNILRQRKEKIEGLELRIETYNEDAQKKDDAFASGIQEARTKGLKEKETRLQAAAEEEKQIITDVNAQAQAELLEIRKKIVKDAEAAIASLQEKVGEFSNDICQKILGRKV